jgi:hypothetical protein
MINPAGWKIVNAVVLYWYNVDPETIARKLFPEANEDYIAERVGMYPMGFIAFWGTLDARHQDRFISLALERYGDEIENRFKLVEADTNGYEPSE